MTVSPAFQSGRSHERRDFEPAGGHKMNNRSNQRSAPPSSQAQSSSSSSNTEVKEELEVAKRPSKNVAKTFRRMSHDLNCSSSVNTFLASVSVVNNRQITQASATEVSSHESTSFQRHPSQAPLMPLIEASQTLFSISSETNISRSVDSFRSVNATVSIQATLSLTKVQVNNIRSASRSDSRKFCFS